MGHPTDEMNELKEQFFQEAWDALDEAENSLLSLERNEEFLENYRIIFRSFHSLKGAAGMFGMNDFSQHFHHLESLMESIKQREFFNEAEIEYFLKGVDAAKMYIQGQPLDFELVDPNHGSSPFKPVHSKSTPTEAKIETSPPVQKSTPSKIESTGEVHEILAGDPTESSSLPDKIGTAFIVDDEEAIGELVTETLEEAGFVTKYFDNAVDLIEALKDFKPDVIISDIMMPGLSGIEMLKKIREFDVDIPLIYLSGQLSVDVCIEALTYGAYGFIEKPFEEKKLIATAVNATQKYQAMKLIQRSINFIMYQFPELDEYLTASGNKLLRDSIETEIKQIVKLRRRLKQLTMNPTDDLSTAS